MATQGGTDRGRATEVVVALADALRPLIPLRIRAVDVEDPSLTLIGDSWSLNLLCPWRIRVSGMLWLSNVDSKWPDKIWDLVGYDIVGVESAHRAADPVFLLSGDSALEVFADTDIDPWSFLLPTETFVGTASTGSVAVHGRLDV